MKRLFLILCSLVFYPGPAGMAQDNGARIRGTNPAYDEGDWISYDVSRYVTSVAVGNQYVYFGTTGGITRFDQYKNSWDWPYTSSNGLADNYVTAVAFDAATGFIWCSTHSAISYYHPTAKKWTNIYKDEAGLPASDDIVSIGIGPNEVYFESRFRRLYRGDKYGGVVTYVGDGLPIASAGIKWFGERARLRGPLPLFYMGDSYFYNQQGYIQDMRLRRAAISTSVTDQFGFTWLGSWGFGALKGELRTQQLELLPFGLRNDDVQTIALDRNGLWIGGNEQQPDDAGMTYWDQVRQRWVYYESRFTTNFTSDDINRLVVAGDTLFCATRFGISMLDIAHDRWLRRITAFDGLLHENVNDLLVDGKKLWIASDRGLNLLDLRSLHSDTLKMVEVAGEDLRFVRINDLEKVENLIWAATVAGVYVYDEIKEIGGFLADASGPSSQEVTAISRANNEIWFGTLHSIEAYNFAKKQWLTSPERNLFTHSPVRALQADDFSVWAGTDNGVMKLNRKNRDWHRFTREDGLIDNRINAILLDGDYVWFGTAHGLTVFYWNNPRRVD